MTDPRPRHVRPKRPLDGTLRQTGTPPLSTIVGFAHVGLGAISVLSAIYTMAFNDLVQPTLVLTAVGVQALLAATAVLGGLWMADGRKRGAIVALVSDTLRCGVLLLLNQLVSFDGLILLVLAGATLWVMPTLSET